MLNRTHFARGEKQLLRRFWQSAGGFWRGPSAWKAWLLVIGLVANVLLALLTQYWLNFWNRDFFNAVGSKDEAQLTYEARTDKIPPLLSKVWVLIEVPPEKAEKK